MTVIDIDTPHGLARAHVNKLRGARGALVLGHGAGGGIEARDLSAAADAAAAQRLSVALVEQPYRVAGRRSPGPSSRLGSYVSAPSALAASRLEVEAAAGLI